MLYMVNILEYDGEDSPSFDCIVSAKNTKELFWHIEQQFGDVTKCKISPIEASFSINLTSKIGYPEITESTELTELNGDQYMFAGFGAEEIMYEHGSENEPVRSYDLHGFVLCNISDIPNLNKAVAH